MIHHLMNRSDFYLIIHFFKQFNFFFLQSSDKVDSPSSDLGNGVNVQLDSPGDESTSLLLDNYDNPSSPITNISSQQINSSIINNQISKRTLDKRRKLLKSSVNQVILLNNTNKSYGQQQNSLRYESLIKRKRILELTNQKLINDRECLLIEKKNIEIKLATNDCENERINIEKRRLELALQKFQNDNSLSPNGNNHLSDQEDHDDNNSLDDISDFNEQDDLYSNKY